MLGISSLEIFSCNERHSGKYTCRASNKIGEDETACKLVVERRPLKRLLSIPVDQLALKLIRPHFSEPREATAGIDGRRQRNASVQHDALSSINLGYV